ncbi:MAG: DegT/DnrJ/EryC1/StrS family aminotransferase [Nitrospirae bacterium]|nr:MAG: DegT/DnrJ/EryC1/StrS family aminotransferase [Nitrospirota bacterium]
MQPDVVPVANPLAQYIAYKDEFVHALRGVLERGRYILGDEVASFELEFAAFLGVGYCVGVGNGTEALKIALKACGVSAGDEVITVSHTSVATVAAIEEAGAVPVFADIDRLTRCMDPHTIDYLITPKTKALLPVHIYGQPAPMREILEIAKAYKLKVIEDCSQAHGAEISGRKVGCFGDAAAFSFYPTKNLGAFGDGGAVVTDNADIAGKSRLLREYGWKERYISSIKCGNSRLDELQAAVLRLKLLRLESDNAKRRRIAQTYMAAINGFKITAPTFIENTLHAMHLFVLETDMRDDFREFLLKEGVGTALHYPMPVHLQPAYAGPVRGPQKLKNTEELYAKIVSLPMFPELTDAEVEKVCLAIRKWAAQHEK